MQSMQFRRPPRGVCYPSAAKFLAALLSAAALLTALELTEAARNAGATSALRGRRPSHPGGGKRVVTFGPALVAVPPGEPLGDALWACTQAVQRLQADCPDCCLLELGGPGLCAFSTARQLPARRVILHPASDRLANLTRTSAKLNGALPNLQVEYDLPAPAGHQQLPTAPAVLLAHLCPGCASPSAVVQQLLDRGQVHALILLLPAQPEPSAQQQLEDLVRAATSRGFLAFWGGFDGSPLEAHSAPGPAPAPARKQGSLQRLLAAAETRAVSVYLARSPAAAPPTLHVFAPLRAPPSDPNATHRLLPPLCRYLLDSASVHNLSVHVVGPTQPLQPGPGPHYSNPRPRAQKIPVLHAALGQPQVRPGDVVAMVDSTDTLAQLSSAALGQRYLDAGSPVFQVSTDVVCWPDYPWCKRYEAMGGGAPNKYVNSGGFIGRAVVVRKYFQDAVGLFTSGADGAPQSRWLPAACRTPEDQGLLACAAISGGNPYGISLDYASAFFHSMDLTSASLTLADGRWTVTATATVPAFVHCNGESKSRLDEVRDGLVPTRAYRTDPGHRLQLDGAWVSYGELCREVAGS